MIVTLSKKLLILLACSTALVPLLLLPDWFLFPFVAPKIYLFRALVSVALIVAGIHLLSKPVWAVRTRSGQLALLTLLCGGWVVAAGFGIDRHRSLWDSGERMLGGLQLAHYVALFLILTCFVDSDRTWRMLQRCWVTGAGAVIIAGLFESSGWQFWPSSGHGRVASTLGQPIYFGACALFLVFAALLLAQQEENGRLRILLFAASVLGFLGVLLSATRSSLVGLAVGLAFLACSLVYRRLKTKRAGLGRALLLGTTAITSISLLGLTLFSTSIAHLADLRAAAGSLTLRRHAWSIAIEGWLERPLSGWGPNNFTYAFDQYFRPVFRRFRPEDAFFDDAHNVMLNTLAEQGLVGLVACSALIASVVYALLLIRRRGLRDPFWVALMGALFIAQFTQKLASFEDPTSLVFLVGYLGLLASILTEGVEIRPPSWQRQVVSLGLIVLGGAALLAVVSEARSNYGLRRTIATVRQASDIADQIRIASPAWWTPHGCDLSVVLSQELLARQRRSGPSGGPIMDLTVQVFEDLNRCSDRSPFDLRLVLATSQSARTAFRTSGDVGPLLKARRHLDRLRVWAPRRLEPRLEAAEIEFELGHHQDAIVIARRIVQEHPTDEEGYWRLASFHLRSGEGEQALAALDLADGRGVRFSARARRIVRRIRKLAGPDQ